MVLQVHVETASGSGLSTLPALPKGERTQFSQGWASSKKVGNAVCLETVSIFFEKQFYSAPTITVLEF